MNVIQLAVRYWRTDGRHTDGMGVNMKHDHRSRPSPRVSPAAASRKVVTAAHGNASVGHNQHSGRRGRRRNNIIGDPANGLTGLAPGARGAPLAPGIGPGGYRGMD
jgi:hypothetical protein